MKQIIIGIPNPKFERKIMKNEARIAKTKFDLLFGHKVGQINRIVAKQELDLLSHLRNIFLKFENDTTSGAHTNVRKPGRTDRRMEGQTVGQTTPYHNTSRFSNGRIEKLKNNVRNVNF